MNDFDTIKLVYYSMTPQIISHVFNRARKSRVNLA